MAKRTSLYWPGSGWGRAALVAIAVGAGFVSLAAGLEPPTKWTAMVVAGLCAYIFLFLIPRSIYVVIRGARGS